MTILHIIINYVDTHNPFHYETLMIKSIKHTKIKRKNKDINKTIDDYCTKYAKNYGFKYHRVRTKYHKII